MSDFRFQPLFELGPDDTEYRQLTSDHVSTVQLDGREILKVDDEIGSIDVGKVGDLVLYDGDPMEYASHACVVVSGGEVVSQTCR